MLPEGTELKTPPQFSPVIGFMSSRYDFGVVAQGETVEHEFEFLNNGTDVLLIEEARAMTSGVGVGVSKEPIEPGQTGKVYVSIKTDDMEGEQFIRIKLTSNAHNGDSTLYVIMDVQSD